MRILRRSIRIARAFPPEFVREMSEVRSKATMAWAEAKKKNDFKLFEPYLNKIIELYLNKIIELSRKAADYLGYDEHPYDALLDLYEEGLRTVDLEPVLKNLKKSSSPFLRGFLREGNSQESIHLKKRSTILKP